MEQRSNIRTLVKRFLPLIIVAITVLIIYALMASRPTPPTKEQEEKAWAVSTEVAARIPVHPQLELLGTVESPYTTQLSAAINADVVNVPAREGAFVAKGEILVELDEAEARLSLQQKQADVIELEASIIAEKNRYKSDLAALESEQSLLEIAKRSVERQRKLAKSNLTSQELIDNSSNKLELQALSVNSRKLSIADHTSRLNQLEAKLARAKANVSNAELDLSRTKITAPYDGQITQVNVSPGGRVRPGEPIVELYDSSQIEVRAQIPDKSINLVKSALKNGEPLKASITIYGEEVTLMLSRLSGKTNLGSGGVDGLFKATSDDPPFIIGSSVKLTLDLPLIDSAITAPISAVYGTNRIYSVKDQRLTSVDATIMGAYFDKSGQQRLILDTPIRDGETFITTQLPNAINGLKVIVRGARL
ncbi:efflux RND transporter periplasmic adaptor subunit [Alkalimarinus sediminis]|uniref:HlyD family efflux transporter periplasmic adaptor subunit n=1 Tax=Alkalimarinus sediminis TaxID=1632866 RepID=A0A9E8KP08_9ALTE|nr:HlyD family efflux transporter periplasmic adaptor subunit [Alkalimarinus sediminis]UZW73715.1 HlyD family efflux transporter periplasmic adaptor subunit [Alkalimarinus sediminis]